MEVMDSGDIFLVGGFFYGEMGIKWKDWLLPYMGCKISIQPIGPPKRKNRTAPHGGVIFALKMVKNTGI